MAQFMRMMQFSDGLGGLNAVKMQQSAVSCYFYTANTKSVWRGTSAVVPFISKCRLLLLGLPAAAKSSLHAAMHHMQNSAIICINKI